MSFLNLSPASSGSVTRQGKTLVISRDDILPTNCIKCGASDQIEWVRQNFRWHPRWVSLLILLNLLLYIIVAAAVSKKMEMDVPVCPVHQDKRKKLLIAGMVLLLGSIPAGIVVNGLLGSDGFAWSLLIGTLMFIAGLIVLLPMRSLLRPVFIDESHGKFSGASQEFLELVDEWSYHPN